jgi:hypothetical protein
MEHENLNNQESAQLGIGTVIARFSDEQIDDLIRELDEYARDYNYYEYGLPIHYEHMDNMRNIVKVKLNGL